MMVCQQQCEFQEQQRIASLYTTDSVKDVRLHRCYLTFTFLLSCTSSVLAVSLLGYQWHIVLVGSLSVTAQLKSRLSHCSVTESQFADDAAIYTQSVEDMGAAGSSFVVTASRLGLTVSFTKTKAMVVNAPSPPSGLLELPEGSIELVPDFKYLGSCISSDGQMTAEISARLAKASRAFGTLRSSVFSNRDLSVKTKVHVHSAVVLSTQLYGCETWAIKVVDVRRLAAFHHRCVRLMLDIPRETQWQEHISNTTFLERAKVQPIEEALKTRRLRWLGHG